MERWYPNLSGVDPKVADAIRLLWDSVYGLAGKNKTPSIISNNLRVEGNITASINSTPSSDELITKSYAESNYSASVISKSISSSGSSPLNLSGLPGFPEAALANGTTPGKPTVGSVNGQAYIDWDAKKIYIWKKDTNAWYHALNIL